MHARVVPEELNVQQVAHPGERVEVHRIQVVPGPGERLGGEALEHMTVREHIQLVVKGDELVSGHLHVEQAYEPHDQQGSEQVEKRRRARSPVPERGEKVSHSGEGLAQVGRGPEAQMSG